MSPCPRWTSAPPPSPLPCRRPFAREPRLRGYLLDDQGSLRRHVALFVDGVQVRDRRGLGDPLQDDSEIYVVQALSGG